MTGTAPRVFRFAPSPNGFLHIGHALSAILNFEAARACQGRFLLRIEDIDRSRSRPYFEAAILEDLRWLGLAWEQPPRRQSEHFADYAEALSRLRGAGLIYPCFCSRRDIAQAVDAKRSVTKTAASDPEGGPIYPGTCRHLRGETAGARMHAGEPHAWRVDMDKARTLAGRSLDFFDSGMGEASAHIAEPEAWGDAVIARKDVPTSYHLAVVVDDAIQNVTDVVRGRDLFAATSLHCLLQALLGLPTPRYCHHRLLLDARGNKLSKSLKSTTLRDLRAGGATPADIRRMIDLA